MFGLSFLLNPYAVKTILRPGVLGGLMSISGTVFSAGEVQFNTDILDLNDRSNLDLSQFSRSGFILPGTYPMVVQVNTQPLPEQPIGFLALRI